MLGGFLRRLARSKSGNTLALVAASIAPLLALIGGGIDMSRSYLSQARLQQACDAGVLAARKKLGSQVVTDGEVPAAVGDVGNRFFNLNFKDGSYGTNGRSFTMSLNDDYSISGVANVNVPTTIMAIFGNTNMPIHVECQAKLNFSDTDVMFVLDTTGSMADTNPGDSVPKIVALRDVVKNFTAQLDGSKTPGTRIRYGFVPYSVNVNVGGLLQDDWVVNQWTYQSRERVTDPTTAVNWTHWENWTYDSGSYADTTNSTYAATWNNGTAASGGEGGTAATPGYYSCNGSQPGNTSTYNDTLVSTTSTPVTGPPAGTKTTKHYTRVVNGTEYWTWISGTTCTVTKRTYTAYSLEFDQITEPVASQTWRYAPITRDVSNWRSETAGCMEERGTYEIYSKADPIDFSRALDLNLDEVPTAGRPETQWRPEYPNIIWERELKNSNASNFKVDPSFYNGDYFRPTSIPGLYTCPAPARKLAEMTSTEVSDYVDSLTPQGYTYHDIGMIWGGRLISPTGLFASENADQPGKTTSRHLIFLTDGITESVATAYGAYGVEPLDQRRWTDRPDPLLNQTIELRFSIACDEVKKRNVTVWVIGFGTTMNQVMKDCAGDGHWFQANNADELANTFSRIAKSLGELRVSK